MDKEKDLSKKTKVSWTKKKISGKKTKVSWTKTQISGKKTISGKKKNSHGQRIQSQGRNQKSQGRKETPHGRQETSLGRYKSLINGNSLMVKDKDLIEGKNRLLGEIRLQNFPTENDSTRTGRYPALEVNRKMHLFSVVVWPKSLVGINTAEQTCLAKISSRYSRWTDGTRGENHHSRKYSHAQNASGIDADIVCINFIRNFNVQPGEKQDKIRLYSHSLRSSLSMPKRSMLWLSNATEMLSRVILLLLREMFHDLFDRYLVSSTYLYL